MGFYSGKMMEVLLLPSVFCPLGAEFLLGAVAASAGAAPAAGRGCATARAWQQEAQGPLKGLMNSCSNSPV